MRMKLAWLLLLPLGIAAGCDGLDDEDPDTDLPGDDDDDDDDDTDDTDDGRGQDQARVRVVHLATAVGDLDLQLERVPEPGQDDDADEDEVGPDAGRDMDDRDGSEIIEIDDIAYGTATAYQTVRAGTRDLFVYPAASNDEVVNLNLVLAADADYTLILWGDGTDQLESLLVLDDGSGLDSDDLRLELSHVGVGLPELDVLDLSDAAPMLLADDLVAGTNDDADVDDDISDVGLDFDDDLMPDLEFDLPGDLGSDRVIHLIASTDSIGDFILVVYPDGRTERLDPRDVKTDFGFLRFINLDPLAKKYDIWVGDCPMPSVTDFRFLSDTDYIPVVPGLHTFRVIPRGSDDALLEFQVDVLADRLHSAALYAMGKVLDAISLLDDDDTGLDKDDFRVQLVNLVDGVGVMDIYRVQAGPDKLIGGDAEFKSPIQIDLDADKAHRIGLDTDLDGKVDHVLQDRIGDNGDDGVIDIDKGEIVNLYLIDIDPDDLKDYDAAGAMGQDHDDQILAVLHDENGKVFVVEVEEVDEMKDHKD